MRVCLVLTLASTMGLTLLAGCSSEPTTVTGSQSIGEPASVSATADEGASAPSATDATTTTLSPTGSSSTSAPGTRTNTTSSTTSAAAPTTYTNPKYGFTGQVPAGYTRSGTVPGDRGVIYNGPNGAIWKLYGSLNADPPERMCHLTGDALGEAKVSFTGNKCTITLTTGTTKQQITGWIGAKSANWLDVTYPTSTASTVEPAIRQAISAFKPGDLTKDH